MSTITRTDGRQVDDNELARARSSRFRTAGRRAPTLGMATNKQEDRMSIKWDRFSSVILRCGLGLGFLSAVADRFGLWGAFGRPNVEWGNFSRFLEYTHTLNGYVPAGMIPLLGGIATGAELLCGLLLLVGWHTRAASLASGLLLLTFGTAMTFALGVKAPLNFAVLTGVGGAWLLATCERFPFSVDQLLLRRTPQRKTEESRTSPLLSAFAGR